MKNDVFNYLLSYFEEQQNKKREIEKSAEYFKTTERLVKSRRLTIDDKDALIDDICGAMRYAIECISTCPYLEIHIRKIIKNTTPRPRKPKQLPELAPAIGFQYEEPEDIYIDDDELEVD